MTLFQSSKGATALSFAALLSLLTRSYADTDLILPEFTGIGRASSCHGQRIGWLSPAAGATLLYGIVFIASKTGFLTNLHHLGLGFASGPTRQQSLQIKLLRCKKSVTRL